MAKSKTLVPLDFDLRKKLGRIVTQYVDSGLDAISDAREWWDFNRAVHRDQNMSTGPANDQDGFRVFHVPVSSVYQSSLVDQICSVVVKQDPLLIDITSEEQIADDKATLVTRVWRKAKFARAFKSAVSEATDTDLAWIRQCPGVSPGSVDLLKLAPEDVSIFPNLGPTLDDVTCIGHRIPKRIRDVQAARELGFYYPSDKDLSDASPLEPESNANQAERAGVSEETGPLPQSDHPVELFECCVWLDLDAIRKNENQLPKGDKAQWYLATVSRPDSELLSLQVYPYSRPWYFAVRLVGSDKMYPATSVARRLWPIQDAFNQLFSAQYSGAKMASMPPIVAANDLTKDGSIQKWYKAGDILKMDEGGGAPWSPPVSANLTPIPVALQMLLQLAYKTSGISENTAGGTPPGQTATAASITAAGTAVKLEGYLDNCTSDLAPMADHLMEIIALDFDNFAQAYNIVPPEEHTEGMPMQPMGAMV